jgi:hypothetical protein
VPLQCATWACGCRWWFLGGWETGGGMESSMTFTTRAGGHVVAHTCILDVPTMHNSTTAKAHAPKVPCLRDTILTPVLEALGSQEAPILVPPVSIAIFSRRVDAPRKTFAWQFLNFRFPSLVFEISLPHKRTDRGARGEGGGVCGVGVLFQEWMEGFEC